MVLSHRAKFQLIINFFRNKAISTELLSTLNNSRVQNFPAPILGGIPGRDTLIFRHTTVCFELYIPLHDIIHLRIVV